ncbi:N-acyl homoserine lactonase family protein [Halalkalicoccus jeotgali]|uniref:Hydrolase (Hydroxyacylglutathione hydrolase) 3 n=1 Tax=Halalkalicoccus jeotgali (strain DSM 18796 / CECT 7217 / JCM 14584 / KCTC 4019 / B3) TaxID=795797 RepID=D8J9G1_HALJB|nr:N-acyl homoserine lactonase family protein [Halalkalicoccus jeotgali]ADJ14373.1 hydrolase (hydroxyacylglutathione hydrolase) 3 [Halalkalicoccus jeotgali B3]ELY40634.1 hydrolase (hydroxyacylglutathione hydrolase) 3 [Halalkalicoccus jeotgali B3]
MIDATITPIDRGRVRADKNYMIEGYKLASASDPNPDAEIVETPVYDLVIEHPEATILWDTGSHPEAGDGYWPAYLYDAFEHYDAHDHPLEDDLERAGYSLPEIDAVIQSHLHLDHAGGLHNFAGTDTPIYVHEEELKHAYYSAKTAAGDPAYLARDFDHDLNWQVVHGERETHVEGIEFLHLPGHTPGLMGLRLALPEAGAVIVAGDQAYVAENYTEGLPLGPTLLWSKRDWYDSLRWLKELERREDATLFFGHDPDSLSRLEGGLR